LGGHGYEVRGRLVAKHKEKTMKIKSVRIRNFRSIEEQTVNFDDYTCLVGANGSGKSTVLHALNVFFHESGIPGLDPNYLCEEDFHNKNTDDPVEIVVTFDELSDEAKEQLSHYVRHDQLIVSAVARFNPDTGTAEVKQFGRRLGIKDFAPFFRSEKEGKKVKELKEIYEEIRTKYGDLPKPGTKDAMISALRSYEEERPEECEEIPSEDQFYGVSKGKNLLEKYVQWIYVPAVKDASTEHVEARNTALGKLLSRTVRAKINFEESIHDIRMETQGKYEELLRNSQDALKDLSEALQARLSDWAHPEATLRLEWRQDPNRSIRIDEPFAQVIVGEAGFEGELTRFGHGLQRSFLLAVLQELSGSDMEGGPRLILACEEPELYQHPPQARHLYNVLSKLSNSNSQVIICTHSPYFVSGEQFESVRLVRKVNRATSISKATFEEVSTLIAKAKGKQPVKRTGMLAKINQSLQAHISEMFFAPKIIFTEGYEDVAYITTYLHLLELWDEYRRSGCHIIPCDGKSGIIQPLAIAKCLGIPIFVIFDSDGHKPDKNGSREKHRKDNETILKLCEVKTLDPFPSEDVWEDRVVMWASEIGERVKTDIGEEDWKEIRAEADKQFGHTAGLRKNDLHIATALHLAWEKGKRSAALKKLCMKIKEFVNRNA